MDLRGTSIKLSPGDFLYRGVKAPDIRPHKARTSNELRHWFRLLRVKVAVVGAGLFGCQAAVEMSRRGHKVSLFEASDSLLTKASAVNQARLHTGLHYPRDFATASAAFRDYAVFKDEFPESVREIEQYYAIAPGSRVEFQDFLSFAADLGVEFGEVSPNRWFRPKVVEGMVWVQEGTFDVAVVKKTLLKRILELDIRVVTSCGISRLVEDENHVTIDHEWGSEGFDMVILATYASLGGMIVESDLKRPKMIKQVTEILIGKFENLENIGITVMDGPFWSTMPFGFSTLHSLSHVRFTPLDSTSENLLSCQIRRPECGSPDVKDCSSCEVAPPSKSEALLASVEEFLLPRYQFSIHKSLKAVKAVPEGAYFERTDARPTILEKSSSSRVFLVLSGKIGSSVSLARELASAVSR